MHQLFWPLYCFDIFKGIPTLKLKARRWIPIPSYDVSFFHRCISVVKSVRYLIRAPLFTLVVQSYLTQLFLDLVPLGLHRRNTSSLRQSERIQSYYQSLEVLLGNYYGKILVPFCLLTSQRKCTRNS